MHPHIAAIELRPLATNIPYAQIQNCVEKYEHDGNRQFRNDDTKFYNIRISHMYMVPICSIQVSKFSGMN